MWNDNSSGYLISNTCSYPLEDVAQPPNRTDVLPSRRDSEPWLLVPDASPDVYSRAEYDVNIQRRPSPVDASEIGGSNPPRSSTKPVTKRKAADMKRLSGKLLIDTYSKRSKTLIEKGIELENLTGAYVVIYTARPESVADHKHRTFTSDNLRNADLTLARNILEAIDEINVTAIEVAHISRHSSKKARAVKGKQSPRTERQASPLAERVTSLDPQCAPLTPHMVAPPMSTARLTEINPSTQLTNHSSSAGDNAHRPLDHPVEIFSHPYTRSNTFVSGPTASSIPVDIPTPENQLRPAKPGRTQHKRLYSGQHDVGSPSGPVKAPPSNITSADSTDYEDVENAGDLLAPLEVLRALADVAVARAIQENDDSGDSHSRTRTTTPERQLTPTRREIRHKARAFPDIVTKNIITEAEARELFRIYYHSCTMFLPVFDANSDTYDTLHERSPLAVNCICMVAARVRDGGGEPSQIYIKCLEEVQTMSCTTLFSPVTGHAAVQAMLLVSGWSGNGWLSGGHAVRMAVELSMHKAWPRLLKQTRERGYTASEEDRHLTIASRTWFCLYVAEHQLSYQSGRPAVLKDDESIRHCRLLLQHPLAIEDDMYLVSTVELMAIRERIINRLGPCDQPVNDCTFEILREADSELGIWYATWDAEFSLKYKDAAFYRQILQLEHVHAELFHNATVLREINGPEDVQKMPTAQKQLALRSIYIARQGLDLMVNSLAYREGMKYARRHAYATATFAASFSLRLARLFPNDCNQGEIRSLVERLASLLSKVPEKRYALTLQHMLRRSKEWVANSIPHRLMPVAIEPQQEGMPINHGYPRNQRQEPFSPTYDHMYSSPDVSSQGVHRAVLPIINSHQGGIINVDHAWPAFDVTANEQFPTWLSHQSLSG